MASAFAQEVPALSLLPEPLQAGQANSREETLYRDATNALNGSQWQAAADQFTQVVGLRGRRADAALYWKSYALHKAGRRQEALAAIAELRRAHPKSAWLDDAGALEVELRPKTAPGSAPPPEVDEETRILVINSLMHSEPERAIPLLQGILDSPKRTAKEKQQALFVLAHSDSPKAQQMVASVARRQSYPELQVKAIEFLGINDSPANRAALAEIYNANADAKVKKAALHAMLVADAKESVLAIARSERDAKLRSEAIHQLGAMEARAELAQMYKASQNTEEKKDIIEALGIADDVNTLSQLARGESDPEAKKAAIRALGVFGGRGVAKQLVEMYRGTQDKAIRRAVVEGLFVNDDAGSLVALARSENDPGMRREIVQSLSHMDEKEARDYMLELLNK